MNENLKALSEEKGRILTEQRSLLDKIEQAGRTEFNEEERSQISKMDNRLSFLDKKIDLAKQAEEDEARSAAENFKKQEEARSQEKKQITEKVMANAIDAYLRFGATQLTDEARSILETGAVTLDGNRQIGFSEEVRALTTGTGSSGGYLIPQGFSGEVDKSLKAYGGMLQAGRTWTTGTGNPVMWPTFNDTANKGRLLDENTDATSGSTDVAFGQKSLGAYTFTSDLIIVPNQLLQDSYFDLNGMLSEALGERLGRAMNQYLTTGTGSSQPQGVVTGSTKGVDAAVSALTFDNIIDLYHSVNSAYRTNALFMFSDPTLAVLRKLKDSEGRYIWQMGDVRTGSPDTLLGKPYIVNDDMATVGASTKSVLFGDFKRFIIRQVQGISIARANERYIESNQTAFIGFMRIDGKLLNTAAVKHILNAAS